MTETIAERFGKGNKKNPLKIKCFYYFYAMVQIIHTFANVTDIHTYLQHKLSHLMSFNGLIRSSNIYRIHNSTDFKTKMLRGCKNVVFINKR